MATKSVITCVVMALVMGSSVDANEDKVAGYMTNLVSDRGTGLVLLWRQTFLAQLESFEDRIAAVEEGIAYAQSAVGPIQDYADAALVSVNAKISEAQALFDSMTIPAMKNETFVAFSTGSGSVSWDASTVAAIKLKTPVVNTGHFDHSTGIFTAPLDGMYWFMVRTTVGSGIHIDMLRNGVDVITSSVNSGHYDIKLRPTITFLSAGDTVALYPGAGQSGSNTLGSGLFFSGMILNANAKLLGDFLAE